MALRGHGWWWASRYAPEPADVAISSSGDTQSANVAAERSESAHGIMFAEASLGRQRLVRQHDTFIVKGSVVGSGDFVS